MTRMRLMPSLLLVATVALSGCDRDRPGASGERNDTGNDVALPRPDATAGSVTGMPDSPGPGAIGPPAVPETGLVLVPEIGSGAPSIDDVPAGEPSPMDAVAVLHDYYAAIGARDYARAHALWSGGGGASGQTLEQFAAGFESTASVAFEPGTPGRIDPGAGSRYIEIPASIIATREDGSVHRYLGEFTLQRAVVDGASPEQRAWRIAAADIREIR